MTETPTVRGQADPRSSPRAAGVRATDSSQPGTLVRLANALVALAFVSLALAAYWPMTRLVDLHRADLGIKGEWIGGHAKRITELVPHGVADLAGLHVGDVLEFDPREDNDWVLAGYRDMPEGFAARLPVLRQNGSRALVMFEPNRVAFLPGLNDVMATLAQLTAASVVSLLGVALIWARPGLMTWSLFMAYFAAFPYFPWTAYLLAYESGRTLEFWSIVASLFLSCLVTVVVFALCFPRCYLHRWPVWKQAVGAALCMAVIVGLASRLRVVPFVQDPMSYHDGRVALVPSVFVPVLLLAVLVLVWSYRGADDPARARLRWVLLGMAAPMVAISVGIALGIVPYLASGTVSGRLLTLPGWVFALGAGIFFPIALGIAVSLLVSEAVGISAAGLVVPGYLALHLDQPGRLASTFGVALATWALVRFGLSRLVVLYGRRRLAVAVLAGFLLNVLAERLLLALPAQPVDARVIGHIVPGLIASEAASQGVVPTFAVTLLVAVAVRLLLVLLLPWVA